MFPRETFSQSTHTLCGEKTAALLRGGLKIRAPFWEGFLQKTFLMRGIVCGRLAAKASLVQGRWRDEMSRRRLPTRPQNSLLLFHRKAVPPLFAGGRKKKKAPRRGTGSVFSRPVGKGFMLLSVRGTGKLRVKRKLVLWLPLLFGGFLGCRMV